MALIQNSGGSGSGGTGTVTGPGLSTDKAIARWDGTTGTIIQDSPGTLVQNSGAIEAAGFITQRNITSTITVNTGESWIAPALSIAPGGVIVLNRDTQLIII